MASTALPDSRRSPDNNSQQQQQQGTLSSFLESDTTALQQQQQRDKGNANNNNSNTLMDEFKESMVDEKTLAEEAKQRTWSDLLFPPLGISVTFWRQGPIDVVSWWLTLACLIAAMCRDPTDITASSERNVIIRCIEIGLSCWFMIEWVLRSSMLGLGEGLAKYFRWLDFLFSAACAVLHILFFVGVGDFNIELLVARSIRLFRPFVRVTSMPAIRVFLTSMTRAVLRGASTIILFVFFLGWFAAAGVYEFGGAIHARCVSNAFFENNTNITAFISESNLSVVDFVCQSGFFQNMDYFGNVTGYDTLLSLPYADTFSDSLSCSSDQTCVFPRDVPTYGGFRCPYAFTCLQVGDNKYYGIIGFDNFFQSVLTLFVSVTFQIWYELEGAIADTGDPGAHWFFLILILIGGFMIANVTTVILTIEFDASMQEEKRTIAEQMSGLSSSRAALQNVVRTLSATQKRNKRRQQMKAKSVPGGPAGAAEASGSGADGSDGAGPAANDAGGMFAAALSAAAHGKKGAKRRATLAQRGQKPSLLDWQNDKAWKEAADGSPVHDARGGAGVLAYEEEMRLLGRDPNSPGGASSGFASPPARPRMGVQEFIKKRIVKTKLFELVTGAVVFGNCIAMALDNYDQSDYSHQTMYRFNIFFTSFYVTEYLVRFAGDGLRAFKKISLNLDLLIAILSIIDLLPTTSDFPGVRAFRAVRLVKLFKFFPSLYEWIKLIATAIKTSPVLLVVMALIQIGFACICMALFGGRFCGMDSGNSNLFTSWTPDTAALEKIMSSGMSNESLTLGADGECFHRARATFDSLGDAVISAYQISTADDWDLIMYNAMRARGWWFGLLFLVYFYIITYLVLSQVVAILLAANKQQDELQFAEAGGEDPMKRLERLEAEAKAADLKKKQEEAAALESARQAAADGKLMRADGEDENEDDDDEEDDDELDDDDGTASTTSGGGSKKKKKKPKKKKKSKKDQRSFVSRIVELWFTVSDTTKEWCRVICGSHKFQWFMSLVILVSSGAMAFETPELAPDSSARQLLVTIDIVVTSLYVLELVLSVHAYGLIRRPTSYLQRDAWNTMDALLVVISVIGLFSDSVRGNTVIRVFRILRAARPLRVVKRSPGMRLVLSSLIGSAKQMVNVFILSLTFFFTLAIIGMQLFGGYLNQCYVGSELIPRVGLDQCNALNGTFTVPYGSPTFDTFGQSFASLFLVATLEGWAGLMYNVMDAPGPYLPSSRGSNLIAAPYFIASSFLLGYFIAGFFVSVLIDAYNREKRQASLNKSLLVLREQEAWMMTARRIARVLPHDDRHIKYDDESCIASIHRSLFDFRLKARNFVESPLFQNCMSFLVLCNYIMMASVTYPTLPYTQVIELLDNIFVFVWIVEALVKIYALSWRAYVMSTWNKLDFVIMLISFFSYILAPFFNRKALSLFRIVRVLRLLRVVRKYTRVTSLIRMMGRAFISLGHVLTFIFLVFFIFAVAGMNLFGRATMSDRYSNFRSLGGSLFLLLRITLGGNWINLYMECATQPPFCDDDIGECGQSTPVPQIYFYFFLFLSTFILKNLFTAVMLDAFTSGGNLRSICGDDAKNFYQIWRKFDEDDAFMIHPFDTLPLLREIPLADPAILGFAHEPRRTRVAREFKFLISLQMLSVHEPVSIEKFVDVLLGFAYAAPLIDNSKLATVREGSAHIIDPQLIQSAKNLVWDVVDDLKTTARGLFSLSKGAYKRFVRASQIICADLAGLVPDGQTDPNQQGLLQNNNPGDEEMKDKSKDGADGNSMETSINMDKSMRRASTIVPLTGLTAEQRAKFAKYDPLAQINGDDEQLTDDEIFSRTASYVMINTLIMRRRQLMREQIRLNERIALRKFDQMGLRGIRKQGDPLMSNASFGNNPLSPGAGNNTSSVGSALVRTSSMGGQQFSPSNNSAMMGSPMTSLQTAATISSPMTSTLRPAELSSPARQHFTHHDEWIGGNKDAVFSPREMALRRAGVSSEGNSLMLRVSGGANNNNNNNNNASFGSLTKYFGGKNNNNNNNNNQNPNGDPFHGEGYFNSVCSYFAIDDRGIFNMESDQANSSSSSPSSRNKNNNNNNTTAENNNNNRDGNSHLTASTPPPPRAYSPAKAPSLVYNVLSLIDDLYNLAHHTLKHDSFDHSVELARCFVELEWWSEAMCDAVRDLPEDQVEGVDVAIALLPAKAGFQALNDLHDDVADGIDRMQAHYEQLIRSDANLELDWFKMYSQQEGAVFEEVASRYVETMLGKSEGTFVPLLAKSYPTLELLGRVVGVAQLDGNKEVDPATLFQAADNAIRKNVVWFSIVETNNNNNNNNVNNNFSNNVVKVMAHCDPEYVKVFQDAVANSTRIASTAIQPPRWKDVLYRVGMRAPNSNAIANFVPDHAKRHLKDFKQLFDWYVEMHKNLMATTTQSLSELAEMRVIDLKENANLVAKQNHQAQQLRLCLQLLEQTYSDRASEGEPSAGLQFANDVAASQHPKKSTVVASLIHAIIATKTEEGERSAAFDIAHAAELTHDCARKALHSLLENIPRDLADNSIAAGIQRTISFAKADQKRNGNDDDDDDFFGSSHNNNHNDHGNQHKHFGLGGMMHDDRIGTSKFASECLVAVSRLAAAVASEPASTSDDNGDHQSNSRSSQLGFRRKGNNNNKNAKERSPEDSGGANLSPDGEPPDAATTRLQSVVSAATGPEFRAKLNLLVESGVVAYVLRAMPHAAERDMMGSTERKNVGISQLNVVQQHSVAPPKRLWLRLSRTMDMFELRQALASSDTSSVVARIPLTSILRLDGDTVGAAQSFGKSAVNAWPFLGSALQGARAMRLIVDTRKFSSNKKFNNTSTNGNGNSIITTPTKEDPYQSSSAAAPLSLMMPFGEGHDSVPNSHERSIVIALPSTVVYGEWLSLLRDVIRQRRLLPVLYASRADQIREVLKGEDKLFKLRSVVKTSMAISRFSHAFGGNNNNNNHTTSEPKSSSGDMESAQGNSNNMKNQNVSSNNNNNTPQKYNNSNAFYFDDDESNKNINNQNGSGLGLNFGNSATTSKNGNNQNSNGNETPRYQRQQNENNDQSSSPSHQHQQVNDFFAPSSSSSATSRTSYNHHRQAYNNNNKPSALSAAAFDDI